jgi:hypothetical protein
VHAYNGILCSHKNVTYWISCFSPYNKFKILLKKSDISVFLNTKRYSWYNKSEKIKLQNDIILSLPLHIAIGRMCSNSNPHSSAEIPTLNMMVAGGRTLGRWLGFEGSALMSRISTRKIPTPLPCEVTMRRWLSAVVLIFWGEGSGTWVWTQGFAFAKQVL